jgi:hypothetical protein
MQQAEDIIEAGFAEPFRERERNGELVVAPSSGAALVALARAGHVPTTLPEPLHDPVIHAALDEAARLSMSDDGDQYADLTDAIRERIQQQVAAKDADAARANRHDRRRAAVLGRKR